jgi:hypothetical protein
MSDHPSYLRDCRADGAKRRPPELEMVVAGYSPAGVAPLRPPYVYVFLLKRNHV